MMRTSPSSARTDAFEEEQHAADALQVDQLD
jgi:hypothetical protein